VRARTWSTSGLYLNFPDKTGLLHWRACSAPSALGGVCMSITSYLDEFDADPETKQGAGHMIASDFCEARSIFLLPGGATHT
jgi:hypothetical protein